MRRGRGRRAARRGFGITSGLPPAVIVGAGRGERARTSPTQQLKQFRNLGGRPLISWSIDTLAAAGCSEIVVVAPLDAIDTARDVLGPGFTFVAGGESRQQSVYNGLREVTAAQVVVHDAVRPFITPELVKLVVEALTDADGAIAAVALDETLKAGDAGFVDETVDRSHLWRAQTPQAFHTNVLVEAHNRARDEGFEATDDAQLVERYGGRVALVPSSTANIKLTWPEDFEVAEALIRSRG